MSTPKINRLVIVGNGFDLMHGLKTSFYDFINYCTYELLYNFMYAYDKSIENKFTVVEDYKFFNYYKVDNKVRNHDSEPRLKDKLQDIYESLNKELPSYQVGYASWHNYVTNYKKYFPTSFIKKFVDEYYIDLLGFKPELSSEKSLFHNRLFNIIMDKIDLTNWGGIESDFYQELLKQAGIESYNEKRLAYPNKNDPLINLNYYLTNLNDDFESIIDHFKKYLLFISDKQIPINKELVNHLVKPILRKEVTNSLKNIIARDPQTISDEYPKPIDSADIKTTLFLDFNYTNTIENLIHNLPNKKVYQHIQIHGELKDYNDPIIFGYGDELDNSYNILENKNNNDYLKYAKSMHYQKTNNYKNLLSFLDENYYQIYIWGHSCAISDRVLLNTLFEHKNCISIKPFYHKKKNSTDNYTDLCVNISRSFKDKKLFRDVVVNKEYCEPLS